MGKFQKKITKNRMCKRKKYFLIAKLNSWCDSHLFIKWIEVISLPYNKLIKKNVILMLDRAPSHTKR